MAVLGEFLELLVEFPVSPDQFLEIGRRRGWGCRFGGGRCAGIRLDLIFVFHEGLHKALRTAGPDPLRTNITEPPGEKATRAPTTPVIPARATRAATTSGGKTARGAFPTKRNDEGRVTSSTGVLFL